MPRYATSGQLGIYWVPSLADTSNPTTVEVAAGLNLAPYLTRDGLKTPTSGNTIDAGIVGTGYSPTVPGTYGGDLIELTLHRGSATADDAPWATLTRGAPGYIVIARTGWNQSTVTGLGAPSGTPSTGDAVEVYTVTVTSRAMADTAENQTSRFTAQLAIAADPRMDATVMGDTTPTGPAAGDLDGTYPNPTVVATHLAAPLPVSQGGTGSATAPDALTALGAVATTDTRLTDARTPTSHAASHATGGSDPIAPSAIGAETPAGTSTAITTHSGATDPHGDRADAATKYTPLTDTRLTNARTPTAHATSHASGGSDPVTPSEIGALASTATLGGDLTGNAPNPTVAKVNGTSVPASPTSGQVLTATSGTAATWQTPAADDAYHPADNNMLWATENPRLASASPSPSNGTAAGKLLLTRMLLRRSTVLTNISFGLAGVDTTGPLSNCYFGIYDSGGTLRASTADVSSTLMGTATPKTIAFSSPYTAAAGEYFIAMLLNGTWTSALTFKSTGGGVTANTGLTAPHLNLSNYGSSQTTLPSTITLSSQATNLITGGVGSTWYGIS